MTTAARRKGSRFELDVVAFLRTHGHPYADARLWRRPS